jgi:hypothetical protein
MEQMVMKARFLALLGVVGLLIASVSAFGWGLYKNGMLVYGMAVGGSSPIDLIMIADYFLIAVTLLILAASLY